MTRDLIISSMALVTGYGEVGQGHIGVNGIVKDKVRGEEENCHGEGGRTEERNIWYLVKCCTVRGQWHIVHCKQDRVIIYITVYYTLYLVKFLEKLPYSK